MLTATLGGSLALSTSFSHTQLILSITCSVIFCSIQDVSDHVLPETATFTLSMKRRRSRVNRQKVTFSRVRQRQFVNRARGMDIPGQGKSPSAENVWVEL